MDSPPESGDMPPAVHKVMVRANKKARVQWPNCLDVPYANQPWQLHRWKDVPSVREMPMLEGFTDNDVEQKVKKYLAKFLNLYNRWEEPENERAPWYKENKVEYWIQEVDRCELDLITPRLIYWSKHGRVTRFKIVPPRFVDDFGNWNCWKVIAFHDFHQDLPTISTCQDFIMEHGPFLPNWYSNWRKWSYEINEWHSSASEDVVPLSTKECEESKRNKEYFLKGHRMEYKRMPVTTFRDWQNFDRSKDTLKRQEYVCGYYKEDANQIVDSTLQMQKKMWQCERAQLWNAGVMNENGTLDSLKLKKFKFGQEAYQACVNELNWDVEGHPGVAMMLNKVKKDEDSETKED